MVNLNYNYDATRMEDEVFYLDGNSTLLALQNGGGKSVFVQMLTAPFVHKRYRDTSDRKFAGYFNTNRPTHILVEWCLDGGAGYVLVGMMVRKNPNGKEEGMDELEIVSFIHEYEYPNPYDIISLPVVDISEKKKTIKGFAQCKQLFDQIRKERGIHFRTYDLTTFNGQRQYFDHLKEYKIYAKEWESIIKKVNLKESGLSELFKDSKNEAGLVEKWFLPTVQDKLNQEQNRIEHFRDMMMKYIVQYKQNESKLARKDTIIAFQEEAEGLRQQAVIYNGLDSEKRNSEDKIAYLLQALNQKVEELEEVQRLCEKKQQIYNERLTRVQYEKASFYIYQVLDELESFLQKKQEHQKQVETLQFAINRIAKQLNILECAKLYGDYKGEEREVLTLENKLELKKSDEQQLLPERNTLGYNLRLYYETKLKDIITQIANISKDIKEVSEAQQELIKEEEVLRRDKEQLIREETTTSHTVASYDKLEEQFNVTYHQKLQRNILGYYEGDTLSLLQYQEEKEREVIIRALTEYKSQQQEVERGIKKAERELGESKELIGKLQEQQLNRKQQVEEYEARINECKIVMQYVSIEENNVFEKELIIAAFDNKIKQLEELKRLQQKRKDELEIEKERLTSGKLLELPREVSEFFEAHRITYIYGMDYLGQQKEWKEKQKQLLEVNPILPYSIILSEQELTRLQKEPIPFYTSYPIPIFKREQLLDNNDTVGSVEFFYSFNEHLLEEEALKQLIQEKMAELHQVLDRIEMMDSELRLYREKRGIIEYQALSKEIFEKACQEYQQICDKKVEVEDSIRRITEKMEGLVKERKDLELRIKLKEEALRKKDRLLCELAKIMSAYEDYKNASIYHQLLIKKQRQAEEQLQSMIEKRELLRSKREDLQNKRQELVSKQKEINEKVVYYSQYKEGNKLPQEIVDIEARFEAITKTMQGDIRDIEENLKRARERFEQAEERLNRASTKFALQEVEFSNETYDVYKEQELEHLLQDKESIKKNVSEEYYRADKEHAIKVNEYQRLIKEMENKFKTSTPVSKEELIVEDFELRRKEIEEEREQLNIRQKETEDLLQHYKRHRVVLAQYSAFHTKHSFAFEEELAEFEKDDLFHLTQKEFERFQGKLLRRYDDLKSSLLNMKEELTKRIGDLRYVPRYEDEFFKKPLLSLYEMVPLPSRLLEQLEINLESFNSQLKKLEIDIAFIGEEKKKLLELLLDYCLEVHKNLGEIDRNSSISLRGKNLKMLQVQVQEVSEQGAILMMKLEDYITELTSQALKRLHKNENIEELIGSRITTKELYDTVIGIRTIQIKLFKIEEQGERKITWSEVCKNSGGEGFLSAFVILTSLLSYMRREETDLFQRKEEGKVLLMDNPFAQTNAAHLLIPLMELAKKNNTQLICLSGLGGESIYNCFDNIYVMNLISSAMNHIQYVKSEQVKGDVKLYEISSSRVQVVEATQMELMF